jgi:AcrR family transcriptional regulator
MREARVDAIMAPEAAGALRAGHDGSGRLAKNPSSSEPPLELKEACVRAAREVIAEKGVDNLSLRDVARKLGVSHQAPYKHYPSRDHLLAEVMRRCFDGFAQHLDAHAASADPAADLAAMGRQYLSYAAEHPLEYQLMFGTPWPEPASHPALVRDACHAFDVLRGVLTRMHGTGPEAAQQVDRDALFIWSAMHGLSGILRTQAMQHLDVAQAVRDEAGQHVMTMIERALRA